jgi:predicted nucleotidyltransferase
MHDMAISDQFYTIIDALNRKKVEYILIGGFAIVIYGFPRFTEDVDFFIRPDQENIEKLKEAFRDIYANDESIGEIDLNMLNEYAVIRYGTPDGFYIDVITRIGTAFAYDDLQFETREVEGHIIRIATVETLIKLKSNTLRPVDAEDVYFLKTILKRNS